jgi:hypothetical protein
MIPHMLVCGSDQVRAPNPNPNPNPEPEPDL